MGTGFAALPNAQAFRIVNATVPVCLTDAAGLIGDAEGLARADIMVSGGRIRAIRPATPTAGRAESACFDADGGMVWPCFVDMHTHLDKGHIWARRPNPDGTFEGALQSVRADREVHWTADDLRRRMDFALRSAFAHGTRAIRTHLDCFAGQIDITWPLFAEMRDAWAGRIDLQGVSLTAIDQTFDAPLMAEIVDALKAHGGILGCVTFMIPDVQEGLDRLFRTAIDEDFDLDFHVDETGDPAARSLRLIADTALKLGFERRITVGHCCALARQPETEAMETLDLVASAGIAVVSLPMCNMYLQDRQAGRTPRWRGVTLLHEMRARGIPVAIASDNVRDPFFAYGDLDALEVFREAARILHLDHPVGDWPRSMTATPASVMNLPYTGLLTAGGDADFVLFRARSWTELLARPQADRTIVRAGKPIDTTLPDYRELDAILGAEQ